MANKQRVKNFFVGIIGATALAAGGYTLGTEQYTSHLALGGVNLYDTESGFLAQDDYAVIDGIFWYLDSAGNEATSTSKREIKGKNRVDFLRNTNLALFYDTAGNLQYTELDDKEYKELERPNVSMSKRRLYDPTLNGILPVADAAISINTASTSWSTSNVASITFSHDTGSNGNNRYLVFTVSHQRTAATSVTVGGNPATSLASSGVGRAHIFGYAPEGVLTGSQNVVVAASNALIWTRAYTLHSVEYSSAVLDTGGTSGSGTSVSDTLTSMTGGYLFDSMYNELDSNISMAAGADQVEDVNSNPNSNQTRAHSSKPADASTEAMSWSWTGTDSYYWTAVSLNATTTEGGGGGGGALTLPQAIIWFD